MSTTTLKTIIQLRRDTAANYELIKDSYIPRNGEVVLVDTPDGKLRGKVGDGVKTYAQLGFSDQFILDAIDNIIIRGYYLNGKFYTDSTYTVELPKLIDSIYIDISTNVLYTYDGSRFTSINDTLPNASDAVAGISKLYNSLGQATDGTVTQKKITNSFSEVSFVLDRQENECLTLNIPTV